MTTETETVVPPTKTLIRQAGFTIMEVLIVLAIIALIMGVLVGPRLFGQANEADIKLTKVALGKYRAAYVAWSYDNSARCPSSLADLEKSAGADPRDKWGNDFVMVCGDSAPAEARPFGVMSVGPDGQQGTEDDILSWEQKK